jgi:uncharacterized protein involved in response to NO
MSTRAPRARCGRTASVDSSCLRRLPSSRWLRNALLKRGVRVTISPSPWLDRAALGALVAVIAVDVLQPDRALAGGIALAAASLLAARLAHWLMTRVALGHSGRPLEVGPAITSAYSLAIVGAASPGPR